MHSKSQFLTGRGVAVAAIGAGFLLALPAPRAQAQVANTLAFFDFNDGTAKDNSGNGNNGTLSTPTAPTATASGFQGGGFQFSSADNGGSGDSFTAPVNLSPSAHPELTFGGWFYVSAVPTPNVGLISNDTGGFKPTLDIDTRGGTGTAWSLFTGSGVLSTSDQVTAGKWTFVAGVYDEANSLVTLYVDPTGTGSGLISASATLSLSTASQQGTTNTTIGKNPNFDNPFTGDMDNVFFVGSALTATQIQNIDTKGQAAFLGSASAPEPGSFVLSVTGGFAFFGLAIRRRARKFLSRRKGRMDVSCVPPLAFHTAASMSR